MIQIYRPEKCPKWVKKKCESLTVTVSGTRYTVYKPSKEIVFYIVYSDVMVSTAIHLCQQLEEQQLIHVK